jgi:hypothetical protein
LQLPIGKNHNKPSQVIAWKSYYEDLAKTIAIPGSTSTEIDPQFYEKNYRSCGIRVLFDSYEASVQGVKQGVLFEVGFDDVTPNLPRTVSSWAYDYATENSTLSLIDNRAPDVACYDPGYTLVEKLQAISTKFRKQQQDGSFPINFLRHYYDVYCLLNSPEVVGFIGSDSYFEHKSKRFRSEPQDIANNEAFLLKQAGNLELYNKAYQRSAALYYRSRPTLVEILDRIAAHASRL